MTGRPLILEEISIALAGETLVAVDTAIEPGTVLTVMGPSGSGKSSLLAFVAGFLDPVFTATGRALIGSDVISDRPAHRRNVGLLFQDPLLFPHLSVGGNLLLAIPEAMRDRKARREEADAALGAIGLDGLFDRDPDTLSGGQKARVALARTLLSRPCALLLDEPFSKLDAALRGQMRDLVFSTARARSLPVLLVTHDEADAEAAGGPVIRVGAP